MSTCFVHCFLTFFMCLMSHFSIFCLRHCLAYLQCLCSFHLQYWARTIFFSGRAYFSSEIQRSTRDNKCILLTSKHVKGHFRNGISIYIYKSANACEIWDNTMVMDLRRWTFIINFVKENRK